MRLLPERPRVEHKRAAAGGSGGTRATPAGTTQARSASVAQLHQQQEAGRGAPRRRLGSLPGRPAGPLPAWETHRICAAAQRAGADRPSASLRAALAGAPSSLLSIAAWLPLVIKGIDLLKPRQRIRPGGPGAGRCRSHAAWPRLSMRGLAGAVAGSAISPQPVAGCVSYTSGVWAHPTARPRGCGGSGSVRLRARTGTAVALIAALPCPDPSALCAPFKRAGAKRPLYLHLAVRPAGLHPSHVQTDLTFTGTWPYVPA